jgi:hypothetical protein
MNTRLRRLGKLALVVMMTTWASSQLRSWAIATAPPTLQDLHGVAELKTLFNRDTGRVRLVLLVSPT